MRALVISGGGSKGAFAGGIAEYLINGCGNDYDLYVGSSTGGLLVSHLALGKIQEIKEIFTTCTQRSIFNINPFSIRHNVESIEIKINHFNTLRAFLMRKKTFGESKNLRKLIQKSLSIEDYKAIKQMNKEIVVTVSNLTTLKKELKSNLENDYRDFIDWIWASANYVPFMSLLTKNGFEYADGGFSASTPIQAAIDRGATSIDVIVLETQQLVRNTLPATNPFGSAMKVFSHMMDQIYHNDISIGKIKSNQNNVALRLFHLPRVITETPLVFEPTQMAAWWKEGYEHAQDVNPNIQVLSA
ncbi:MAG: patatin-like phospholipase family protein [Crocinitomicaceae bacterium]